MLACEISPLFINKCNASEGAECYELRICFSVKQVIKLLILFMRDRNFPTTTNYETT